MSGEIMYDLNEINNNALQIFNQAVKSLNDAAECLNGISTSGLDLQLNTDKIKAEINEKRSIIISTIASIINILSAFEQVEKDNIKILDALIYSIEFFKGLFDIFKAPEKGETIDIWKEEVKHKSERRESLGGLIFIPDSEDGKSKALIVYIGDPNDNTLIEDTFKGYNGILFITDKTDGIGMDEIVNGAVEKIENRYKVEINTEQTVVIGDKLFNQLKDKTLDRKKILEKIFGVEDKTGSEDFDIEDKTESEDFDIEDKTESETPKGWEGVTEWTSKIVKKGNQWIREKIPLIPQGFQNDDPTKANYNYGKAGSNVFKGACGLFAGCINPRALMGGVEIALETWLKIQRGISSGGSDGSLYGSIAQTMEFCRIYNFRKI